MKNNKIEPLNKDEIRGQLDYIYNFLDNEVHLAVLPDKWWIYSILYDEIKQLEIILKQYGVIDE